MFSRVLVFHISCILVLGGCSSQRKLSHVDSREPAAARSVPVVSNLREQLLKKKQQDLARSCPKEVGEFFSSLVEERVQFPSCPERLQPAFEAARNYLLPGEKSVVQELLNGHCRSFGRELSEDLLGSLMPGPVSPNVGQHDLPGNIGKSVEGAGFRTSLRNGLLEVRDVNESLEQWIRINGDFVIPDEPLQFLDLLVNKQACKLTGQEVDQAYRTIRSLEDLAKIDGESDPQRKKLERFLVGIHKLIDRKIQEFFQP